MRIRMYRATQYSRPPYPAYALAHIVPGMDIARFIRTQRNARGVKQAELGDICGVSQGTVSRWEKGSQDPDGHHLVQIAAWAGISVEELTGGAPNPTLGLQALKVVGAVQAGEWSLEPEFEPDAQFSISVPPSNKFPNARRTGLIVRGPSMNEVYPDGSIIICVSIFEVDRDPRPGERVVVRRKNAKGLYEVTVKEFYIDDAGRKWLVPRSSDPQFKTPMRADQVSNGEEVMVTGIVIGSYRPE